MAVMHETLHSVRTVGGVDLDICVYSGGQGPELLYLHGATGVFPNDPFLAALSERFTVYAPLFPGYGASDSGDQLRHMLDFTLHTMDVVDVLQLERPLLVGHAMGGMVAAEMAALNPQRMSALVLLAPMGLWLDDYPVTDLFATLPYELPQLLFADADAHGALLSAGGDLNDPEFLTEFMVGNARRLGSAGKLLFPIPDRGLGDRLYRITAPTRIMWGSADRILNPVYAGAFGEQISGASVDLIQGAGHLLQYENTQAVVTAIAASHNQ